MNLQSNRSRSAEFQSLTNLDRPDLAPGRTPYSLTHGVSTANGVNACPTAGRALGTPTLWYDPCGFMVPALGFLGNSGRNILRGPGLNNLDFSMVKNTAVSQLGENGRIEFRAEFFNVLNHPNFDLPARTGYAAPISGTPAATASSAQVPLQNAGVITSTGGSTSRQIQFALKIMF